MHEKMKKLEKKDSGGGNSRESVDALELTEIKQGSYI